MKRLFTNCLAALALAMVCGALVACETGEELVSLDPQQNLPGPENTFLGASDPANENTGNTDPTNTNAGNTSPVNSGSTSAQMGTIDLLVEYSGNKTGNLQVILFTNYPPQGPPVAVNETPNVVFPASVSMTDIAAGTYTALVMLDVAPFDPANPGAEDVMTTASVVVPSANQAPLTVVLVDAEEETTMDMGPTNVDLQVDYSGTQAGNLVVGLFDAWPATGPPKFASQQPNVAFPTQVTLSEVPAGTYTALVMLDAEPFDPGNAGPEDRMVTMEINVPVDEMIMVTLTDENLPAMGDEGSNDANEPQEPAVIPDLDPNGANIKVLFDGANAEGNVVMAFFGIFPPVGPPVKVEQINNAVFPAYGVVTGLDTGIYTVVVKLDRAPFNPSVTGPEDISANVEIVFPTGDQWVEVVLEDPLEGVEIETIEYEASESLYVSTGNPYNEGELVVNTLSFALGQNDAPTPTTVYVPEGAEGDLPLLVFQHGFSMDAVNYSGILEHLASQGFVVVAPQMYEAGGAPFGKPSSEEEATLALSVYDWVQTSLVEELSVTVDINAMGLLGHSRGAKVAWATLLQDTGNFAAIAGIDPVDGSEGITSFDSKLLTSPLPFSMPSLVIGAGLGGQQGVGGFAPACAPEGQNHVQFFSAVQSPAWHVTIAECGHLDMLNDEGCGLQCLACPSGNNKAIMRKATGGILTAFFRGALGGNDADFAFLEDANTAITPVSFESK